MRGKQIPFGRAFLLAALAWPGTISLGGEEPSAAGVEGLRKTTTDFHILYTDLPDEKILEAAARLDATARGYRRWIPDSSSACPKQPVYLYRRHEDYLRSLPRQRHVSAAFYDGVSLRAAADTERFSWDGVWSVVQHEGWHQFSHRVVAPKHPLPIWLEEALAEYFGAGLWTGERLACGAIDSGWSWGRPKTQRPGRLRRVRQRLRVGQFQPMRRMIASTRDDWSKQMNVVNYDQVWSMIHFFLHAYNGKYRRNFTDYLDDMIQGRPNLPAFEERFGKDMEGLEKEYRRWWLGLEDRPSADLYDQITVETLLAYLARWRERGKDFPSAEAFFDAVRQGKAYLSLKDRPASWLPSALLDEAMTEAQRHATWRLGKDSAARPTLTLIRDDGVTFEGTYRPDECGDRLNVTVTIHRPAVPKTLLGPFAR
jgi:hypothetical protein